MLESALASTKPNDPFLGDLKVDVIDHQMHASESQKPIKLKLDSLEDRLFESKDSPMPFSFNQSVAQVFDDMIRRSVPMYETATIFASLWAQKFAKSHTKIYDLGCSTGTTIDSMGQSIQVPVTFVGIDRSEPMIEKARVKLKDFPHSLELWSQDLRSAPLESASASVVIANYTLQFLSITDRTELMKRVYDALIPGGLFLMSEKVSSDSNYFQETTTAIYESFKEVQGYSKTEIARKKQALEHVLTAISEQDYRQMLAASGFDEVDSIIKWNNFVTLVARKS